MFSLVHYVFYVLSITVRLPNLLECNCLILYNSHFYFHKVSRNFPSFISKFSYLGVSLSLFFLSLSKGLSILLIFSKNQLLFLLTLLCCFSILYFLFFICLCSYLHYFFPSANCGISLSFTFVS